MEDLKYTFKVMGLWTLGQLAWAALGLSAIYGLDLSPTDLQMLAYVGLPYLVVGLVSLYDTFRPGKIKSKFLY